MLNSEEIKPMALSIVEICLAGSISRLVGWSVDKILLNNFFLKFCRNFLKGFWVGLRAFLALAVPNQCY